jgi:hypothetical protein
MVALITSVSCGRREPNRVTSLSNAQNSKVCSFVLYATDAVPTLSVVQTLQHCMIG